MSKYMSDAQIDCLAITLTLIYIYGWYKVYITFS